MQTLSGWGSNMKIVINFQWSVALTFFIYAYYLISQEPINYYIVFSPMFFYFVASWIMMKIALKGINLAIKNGTLVHNPNQKK